MSNDAPDEQHHFIACSIERFGDRHFLEWYTFRSYGGPSGRVEISEADYQALLAGNVGAQRLIRKYDRQALTRGLENPSLGVKVFLLATLGLFTATLVALLAGWI